MNTEQTSENIFTCTLFDINTVFFIENTNFYCKRRGKHSRMTKFVWEGGGRTIFGLASGKGSKRGCEGGVLFPTSTEKT